MLAGRVAASFAGWRGLGMSGAPDELLGHRYRLEALLGQGGMGTVFRAYDRLTGQRVALKVVALEDESAPFRKRDEASAATVTLSPELLDELDRRGDATTGRLLVRVHAIVEQLRPTQRLRLARSSQVAASPSRRSSAIAARMALAQEFRTLASLRHPHIISVLDYGFAKPERPFFTMELLENAQTLVTTCRELPHSERARLLVQLLTALSYLHRHGVVHCDLKPADKRTEYARAAIRSKDHFSPARSVAECRRRVRNDSASERPRCF